MQQGQLSSWLRETADHASSARVEAYVRRWHQWRMGGTPTAKRQGVDHPDPNPDHIPHHKLTSNDTLDHAHTATTPAPV